MASVRDTASAGLYARSAQAEDIYARLTPLDSKVTGHEASSDLRLTVSGDTVMIALDARGPTPFRIWWRITPTSPPARAA
jgi:hypothetical protein